MAWNFMIGARLVQAIEALVPKFAGRDQEHLVGLADAAAGAAYDAAYDHIEVLEEFRSDLQSPVGASLIGTASSGEPDLQTVLDTLREDVNSIGGGGGGYAQDADVVHKTGSLNETVTGEKTFSSTVTLSGDPSGVRLVIPAHVNASTTNLNLGCGVGGTVRLRPEGVDSDTNALIVSGGTAVINGIELGYRNLPRVTTFNADAAGKMLATAANLTIDTGVAAGTLYSIYNNSGLSITITQGSGMTLRLAGTSSTGSRTLAARGIATIWFNSTTEAICSGVGLT